MSAARIRRQIDTHYLPGFIWTIIRTDFKSRYHGTIGGFLWALLRPTAMFVVLLSVFSFIFRVDPDYNLNLVLGLFLWDFWAEATKTGVLALHTKSFLLTKAKVPTWTIVLTSASNALISITIFSIVACCYIALFKRPLGPIDVLLYLGYIAVYLIQVTGLSLATSVLFLRYRDLNQIWDLVVQVGFFIAPVIYPLHILPEEVHFYFYAWLPTPIIEFSRELLVRGQIPTLRAHALMLVVNVAVLVAGVVIFRRHAPRAVEAL